MGVMAECPIKNYKLNNNQVITSIDYYTAEINPSNHRIKSLNNN